MRIVRANSKHLADLLAWLEVEEHETGEGFNCNRQLIVRSQSEGDLYCLLKGQDVVAFSVLHSTTESASISLLEVRPGYRGQGIGKLIASDAIKRLFKSGASFVNVECAPQNSENFWRTLGFQPTGEPRQSVWENPKLVLQRME